MSDLRALANELLEASCLGDLDKVTSIVRRGANINAHNPMNGWTALHWAAKRDHVAVVEFLVGRGADISLKSKNGESAAEVAGARALQILTRAAVAVTDNTTAASVVVSETPPSSRSAIEDAKATVGFVPNYLANPEFFYAHKDTTSGADSGGGGGGGDGASSSDMGTWRNQEQNLATTTTTTTSAAAAATVSTMSKSSTSYSSLEPNQNDIVKILAAVEAERARQGEEAGSGKSITTGPAGSTAVTLSTSQNKIHTSTLLSDNNGGGGGGGDGDILQLQQNWAGARLSVVVHYNGFKRVLGPLVPSTPIGSIAKCVTTMPPPPAQSAPPARTSDSSIDGIYLFADASKTVMLLEDQPCGLLLDNCRPAERGGRDLGHIHVYVSLNLPQWVVDDSL